MIFQHLKASRDNKRSHDQRTNDHEPQSRVARLWPFHITVTPKSVRISNQLIQVTRKWMNFRLNRPVSPMMIYLKRYAYDIFVQSFTSISFLSLSLFMMSCLTNSWGCTAPAHCICHVGIFVLRLQTVNSSNFSEKSSQSKTRPKFPFPSIQHMHKHRDKHTDGLRLAKYFLVFVTLWCYLICSKKILTKGQRLKHRQLPGFLTAVSLQSTSSWFYNCFHPRQPSTIESIENSNSWLYAVQAKVQLGPR